LALQTFPERNNPECKNPKYKNPNLFSGIYVIISNVKILNFSGFLSQLLRKSQAWGGEKGLSPLPKLSWGRGKR
jgi:hypothetical protein